MTRGSRIRRGVVVLSLVVTGAAGCAPGRSVGQVVPPPSHPTAAPATSRPAAPTRTTRVIDFPVGSWRRLPLSPPVRVEIPAGYRDNLVVSAVRVADGGGRAEVGR
jgi:hypothetical protein